MWDDGFTLLTTGDSELAGSPVYTPAGGSAITITAVVTRLPSEMIQESNHVVEYQMINVACVPTSSGIQTPKKGDTIVWNGATFAFEGYITQNAGWWELKFKAAGIKSSGSSMGRHF